MTKRTMSRWLILNSGGLCHRVYLRVLVAFMSCFYLDHLLLCNVLPVSLMNNYLYRDVYKQASVPQSCGAVSLRQMFNGVERRACDL